MPGASGPYSHLGNCAGPFQTAGANGGDYQIVRAELPERAPGMIPGIDTSSAQGKVDWAKVKATGVHFLIRECGYGNEGADLGWLEDVTAARAAGLVVGVYHFAFPLPADGPHPNRDPRDQARHHFDLCGALGRAAGDLPPCLDLEWPVDGSWARWGCSAAQIRRWALDYLECARELYEVTPLLYTYPDFWRQIAGATEPAFAQYPLWLASYAAVPAALGPWAGWSVWQHSDHGTVDGIDPLVDLDWIAGEDELAALLARPATCPTDPAPVAA
jgi:lysozyme